MRNVPISGALRLRQLALVADRLAPVEQAITAVFGLAPCHRDPAVAQYGLENVLFPLGCQFVEVVAPTRAGTAAGRYLERRGGDGGYMVITQCDDHAAYRARVDALGVRIAHEFQAEGFLNMQLHPRDTGGSFFEIDQQLGAGGERADGPWVPAGGDWQHHVRSARVAGIAAAEIQAADPRLVAARWAAIAGRELAHQQDTPVLALDDAMLRFVPAADGRGEGLAGIDLHARDAAAVRDAARTCPAAALDGDTIHLAGIRWRLIEDRA